MKVLGHRIKTLREEKNLTQVQLGNLINASKTTISNYETGYSSPDTDTLSKLATIFETTTDYLIGRTDLRSPSADDSEKKNSRTLDVSDLPEEAVKRIEEYIELIRLKYKSDGSPKK